MSEFLGGLKLCRFGPCLAKIAPAKFYCDEHWSRIPRHVQHEIAEAWSRQVKALPGAMTRANEAIMFEEKIKKVTARRR